MLTFLQLRCFSRDIVSSPAMMGTMASLRVFGLSSLLLLSQAVAQLPSGTTDGLTLTGSTTLSVTEQKTPTGTYQSFSSKITLASTPSSSSLSVAPNATSPTDSTSTVSTSSNPITVLSGSPKTTTTMPGNSSTTSTTSSQPTQTNTTPCNGHPEFCDRKYSNITMIAAHNSPFVRPRNVASNQEYDVTTQLNDGVRFLQAQMQWNVNDTVPHFCHTTCDLLDAGPITDWLTQVTAWVASHPYDVVTVLLGNGNYSQADKYVPYIEQSGILRYIYTPPVVPMNLTDWPTLSEMVLQGKRVVMFMDYNANQTAYPWLLDQFSQLWETPFDPTDQNFPCTVQRPPDLAADQAKARMYMHNHDFNVEINAFGAQLLVPAVSVLNQTNNVTGFGSLGEAAEGCRNDWGRAPNFLNVDYYNYGGFPGSVFEVAATMNNVTYDRGTCCGTTGTSAVGRNQVYKGLLAAAAIFGAAFLI